MKTGVFHRMMAELRRRRQRNASIRELMALDDHQLADIGLLRSEIPEVVDELVHLGKTSLRREWSPASEVLEARKVPSDEPRRAA